MCFVQFEWDYLLHGKVHCKKSLNRSEVDFKDVG